MNNKDLQDLTIVRDFLIKISKNIYRDYKFFFQAENKEQRRKIYNQQYKYEEEKNYSIVCKTLCLMVKKYLNETYQMDVEIITCDNDEFGHYDILVNGKYIINCLSDLERNQVGMKPKRFASYKYCLERYPSKINELAFLTEQEVEKIDEKIGYKSTVYLDDAIKLLKEEFNNIEYYLKNDPQLKYNLTKEKKEKFTKEELLKIKMEFLIKCFGVHGNIIGFIELVRTYKILIKQLFDDTERKIIKSYNCFTDQDIDNDIFKTPDTRKRFIAIKINDSIYIITIIKNKFMKLNIPEWEQFQKNYNITLNEMVSSTDNINEILRNKGIGVNIMKHTIVKQVLTDINDAILKEKTSETKEKILNSLEKQGNIIEFKDDNNNNYIIILNEKIIIIKINDYEVKYYYDNDILVSDDGKQIIGYEWIDEGKYEKINYKKK
ncbi:MAG: hypothetical protein J6B64_01955 [Bacilli bacterium]|nr:hypothetical protein [Bacilli bacterium]MBP3921320.1 hypothetical protein [Bacilli bacterium]